MQQLWKNTVMGMVYALILFVAGSLLYDFFNLAFFLNLAWLIRLVFLLAAVGGVVWFFLCLSKFIDIQSSDEDKKAVTTMRTAYIIMAVGMILHIIPLIGWIFNLICAIVAYILLILAFGKYSTSTTLTDVAQAGVKMLKVYAIVGLVCAILLIIPIVDIVAWIGFIVAYVCLFLGWIKVSTGGPLDDAEKAAAAKAE